MPSNPLRNFQTQNYYEKKPKFNGVYSRINLPQINYRAYVINHGKYKVIGIHWIACMLIIKM